MAPSFKQKVLKAPVVHVIRRSNKLEFVLSKPFQSGVILAKKGRAYLCGAPFSGLAPGLTITYIRLGPNAIKLIRSSIYKYLS